MSLPYPIKVVLPFDIATAQDMNERHANDVALAEGTGLNDGAVTADKIDFSTVGVASGTFDSTVTNRVVTGLGFKPRIVEFMFFPAAATTAVYMSNGFMCSDGSQGATAVFASGSSTRRISDSNRCLIATNATASFVAAQFVSMDNDGFSINFIATGNVTDVWSWRALQ